MSRTGYSILAALAVGLGLGFLAHVFVAGIWPGQSVVKRYILNNPSFVVNDEEIVKSLSAAFADKQDNETLNRRREIISSRSNDVIRRYLTPMKGLDEGANLVIIFYDYRCGPCKQNYRALEVVMGHEPGWRFVFKELPNLGDASVYAARLALAAAKKDKFFELHEAYMTAQGNLTAARVLSIAENLGLDRATLEEGLGDQDIRDYLDDTRSLASALGISETPAILINGHMLEGAVNAVTLTEALRKFAITRD